MLQNPTLIVVCGLPLTGKSTIAGALSQRLGIRHIDIDENVRFPLFRPAPEGAHTNKEAGDEMRAQMLFSYEILCHSAGFLLSRGKSVVITATFSKTRYWDLLLSCLWDMLTEVQQACVKIKIILCKSPEGISEQKEIEKRIALRQAKGQYFGGCRDAEHYFKDKAIFQALPTQHHCVLHTFPPHTIEDLIDSVLPYIKN